jgi:hypothetical protein
MPPKSPLTSLDVPSWRRSTPQEVLAFIHRMPTERKPKKKPARGEGKHEILVVREQLAPVDIYCYLKARFGEPNGYQTRLARRDSDNWIHWDYLLKSADDRDIYLCGMSRETHFMIPDPMTPENWRDLIKAIKNDFARMGKEKGAVFKTLEKWVVFPNRFIEVADICADLHAEIEENIEEFTAYKTASHKKKQDEAVTKKKLERFAYRATKVYRPCLELSLLTPVLAETFINMLILILCKQEVRRNERQFSAFIRANIDVKLFDLHLKCEGFARGIDAHSPAYKKFKQVMDKRNDIIHGNANPEAEQLETVYFEGKRPLYKVPGDNIGKFWEAKERQYQPAQVIQQYVDVYAFLLDIVGRLEKSQVVGFWAVMEDSNPGYEPNRRITGHLFPNRVVVGSVNDLQYDDQLPVEWV